MPTAISAAPRQKKPTMEPKAAARFRLPNAVRISGYRLMITSGIRNMVKRARYFPTTTWVIDRGRE